MATTVIFRADRSGDFKGQVTAVFPADMSCYAHIGQHSECGDDWYRTTRPATPAEYASLHRELVQIGYDDLVVRKRRANGH